MPSYINRAIYGNTREAYVNPSSRRESDYCHERLRSVPGEVDLGALFVRQEPTGVLSVPSLQFCWRSQPLPALDFSPSIAFVKVSFVDSQTHPLNGVLI